VFVFFIRIRMRVQCGKRISSASLQTTPSDRDQAVKYEKKQNLEKREKYDDVYDLFRNNPK
jgi:hypothetical protein